MIVKALIEGIKSVAVKSLTSTKPRRIISISTVFVGGIAVVSFILAEIFLGFSVYSTLHFDCGYGESFSMLSASLMYIAQVLIATLVIRHHLKKTTSENVLIKEYKLVKGVVSALIAGYKSKN